MTLNSSCFNGIYEDDSDIYELVQERNAERRKLLKFKAAPDFRDPEHPEDEGEEDDSSTTDQD